MLTSVVDSYLERTSGLLQLHFIFAPSQKELFSTFVVRVMEWGPLQPIRPYLASQEGTRDGEGDAKYLDDRLAQRLVEEELVEAVRAASIAQLDAVLSHEAITVKHLPLSFLLLV